MNQYLEVFDHAAREFAPQYVIRYLSPQNWCKAQGDCVDCPTHFLDIPRPDNPNCLFVALHEIGHIVARDPGTANNPIHAERTASFWAKSYMEDHGMTVPEPIWQRAIHNWTIAEGNFIIRNYPELL